MCDNESSDYKMSESELKKLNIKLDSYYLEMSGNSRLLKKFAKKLDRDRLDIFLMRAIRLGVVRDVDLFLREANCDISKSIERYISVAARYNDVYIMKLLLEKAADTNNDLNLATAIEMAIGYGNYDATKFLLELQRDDVYNKNPLLICSNSGDFEDIMELVLYYDGGVKSDYIFALERCLEMSHVKSAQVLIKYSHNKQIDKEYINQKYMTEYNMKLDDLIEEERINNLNEQFE